MFWYLPWLILYLICWLIDWLFLVLRPVQEYFTCIETSLLPVQNLGLCSALRAFEHGGIFIVPNQLWHETSVFPVSTEGPPQSVAFYSNPDPHGDICWNDSHMISLYFVRILFHLWRAIRLANTRHVMLQLICITSIGMETRPFAWDINSQYIEIFKIIVELNHNFYAYYKIKPGMGQFTRFYNPLRLCGTVVKSIFTSKRVRFAPLERIVSHDPLFCSIS